MSSPTLCGMPNDVMDNILANIDLRSILCLRKVCRDLRHYIDDVKPDGTLTGIRIFLDEDDIALYFGISGKEYRIRYAWDIYNKNRYIVERDHRRPVTSKLDFFTMTLMDLGIVFKFQKRAMGSLQISWSGECSDYREYIMEKVVHPFLDRFRDLLRSFERPIKVTELYMVFFNENEVMKVLPFIDSETFKTLKLAYIVTSKFHHDLDMSEIEKTSQWNSAEELNFYSITIRDPIEKFAHFISGDCEFASISVEELVMMKDKYIHCCKRKQISFRCSALHVETMEEVWGPATFLKFTESDSRFRHTRFKGWFFKTPRPEHILRIGQSYMNDYVFSNIAPKDVPLGAVVLD